MAQYDLLLTQNTHATLTEFSEKYVNLAKGSILSADTNKAPTVLAAGADGSHLVRDDAEVTGLKWVTIIGGHTQGTDVGTTSTIFELDSDGYKIELTAESASKMGAKVDGGATYVDFQAKDGTFNKITVGSASPTGAYELTHKTYVDGLLAANDAMIFKGTVGTGGTIEIAALNALATYTAGWAYKVITAGTIKGQVCEIGDMVVATVDRAGSSNVDADFIGLQTNMDGVVIGPASTTDSYPAIFNGTTGKLLKAGTAAIGTMAYETATNYMLKSIYDANSIIYATTDNTPVALTVGASTIVGRKATGDIVALTKAETLAILNVTDGATANTKATGAEIDTGTDDVKFATPKAIADAKVVKGPASAVDVRIAVFSGTSGKLLADSGKVVGDFATAAQGTTADGAVPKSTYDAHTILYATTDNTPAALTVGASTVVGRAATGNIVALDPAGLANVLCVVAPAAKTSTGVAGQIAFDANFMYRCTATDTWKRTPLATNW